MAEAGVRGAGGCGHLLVQYSRRAIITCKIYHAILWVSIFRGKHLIKYALELVHIIRLEIVVAIALPCVQMNGKRFSCPSMSAPAHVIGFPRLLQEKATRKGRPRRQRRHPRNPVLLRARDLRWNWLGHILRMNERRTVRQVLLNCVKPTPKSIFGDLIDLDVNEAISLAKDRIEWKKNRPSKRC